MPDGAWYTASVERLAELGIAAGDPDGTYRPDSPVMRAEMAVFLIRALGEEGNLPSYQEAFADVPAGAWYTAHVERVAQLNITHGCTSSTFCPFDQVRRDQMASFLARSFDLPLIEVGLRRSLVDRPDQSDLPRIHVVYIVTSDVQDLRIDVDGTLDRSIKAAQTWFREQTGGRELRFDTFGYGDQIDISFARSALTSSQIPSYRDWVRLLEPELKQWGFWGYYPPAQGYDYVDTPDKVYLFFYGGGLLDADSSQSGSCGATYPFGRFWTAAVIPFACLQRSDWWYFATSADTPGSMEYVILHELVHVLGFVPECAPNHSYWHVDDDSEGVRDLMGDGSPGPPVLDVGRDDYFMHDNPDCPDLADSPFLTP